METPTHDSAPVKTRTEAYDVIGRGPDLDDDSGRDTPSISASTVFLAIPVAYQCRCYGL